MGISVVRDDFSDATLILVAHGSTVNADSAVAAQDHAQALHALNLFRDVVVAFWKQPPFIRDVAAQVQTPRVFVVPLFLSAGYFTQEVIPRELGLRSEGDASFARVQKLKGRRWFYGDPIGTHPRMTDVVLVRAEEVVRSSKSYPPEPARTALFIAAHGTGKNDQSRKAAEWHADRIRAQGRFAGVRAIFMEEEPRISNCLQSTDAPNVIVVPFFISDGLHAREDVPVLLGEPPDAVQDRLQRGVPTWQNPTERSGKRVWYSISIGTAPLVRDLVLERVREINAPSF